eukprot:symbB.v1.2.017596.t1/scaffold1362.1/size123397/3
MNCGDVVEGKVIEICQDYVLIQLSCGTARLPRELLDFEACPGDELMDLVVTHVSPQGEITLQPHVDEEEEIQETPVMKGKGRGCGYLPQHPVSNSESTCIYSIQQLLDLRPRDGGGRSQTSDARSPRSRAREQWPEPPQRSVSRRSRRRNENGKSGGKGESKGKTKKDGALHGGRSSGLMPDLPQLQAEAPWLPPAMPAAPPAPAPPPQASQESAQMRSLLSALKKASADLPPDVQAAMQKLNQDDGKTMTKQLHAAVSNLGNAKKSLAELSLARANLHTGWNSFLEAAITRWQRYSEEFTQQDQDLAGQIEKAKEAVKVCKENFRSLQKSEGVAKDDTAEVISDEEELTVPSKVDEHMSQMQQSLMALKGGMEEELRPSCQSSGKQRSAKKVHFDNFVGLRMSKSAQVADFTVAHDLLGSWSEKPWRLRPSIAAEAMDTTWLMQTGLETRHQMSSASSNTQSDQLSEDIIAWLDGVGCHSPSRSQVIMSHGLSERSVGTRSFVLEDPRPSAFLAQLRATWPEYDDAVLRAHLVLPQPVDLTPQRHIVVEFLIHGFADPLTPTLEESIVWGAFGQTDLKRAAAYHEARLHHSDVTSPFASLCKRAQYICTVRAQGKVLPLDFARSICSGALIQLHAYPPCLHEPIEQPVPISGLAPFFADSAELLGSFQLPVITWRVHLLQADGYHGPSESIVPASNLAAPLAVVDFARSIWISVPLSAMTYAGLSWAGDFDHAIQEFIIFDPESIGFPCLIRVWIDPEADIPLPPPVAALLPAVCTLRGIVEAIDALWLLENTAISVEVSDGFLTYDHSDRFRPRHGATYIVLVKPVITDEMSSLQTMTARTHLDLNVGVRHGDRSPVELGFCDGMPSRLRLIDEWVEQTTLPESFANEPENQAILDETEPLLIIDGWERLLHLLTEAFNQVEELQLTMHGLFWTDIGCRFAFARPDIPSIREAVIRSWEDFLRENLVGYLHLIVPQERLQVNEITLIVEMRLPHAEPPEDGAPILRRITWHYLESDPQVLAVYQTSGMSRSGFLAQAGLAPLCLAPDSRQCNLHVEKRIQLPFSPVILQPGSLVEIFLHGVETEDASHDEAGLMQQPKPSLSPDLIPIRLLGLNYVNTLFHANQDESLIIQLRQNWPLATSRPENLEAVHYVACPPATSGLQQEHFYLIQQREDRFSQIHTNDVLLLVTISFTAPDRSKIQKLRVLL